MNKKFIWYVFYALNWAVIFWFWFQGSGELLVLDLPSVVVALGRLVGLTAAYLILLQFFFMGRTPYLERVFGLDKLSRVHHTNGKWGLLFLLLHPILLTLGYSKIGGISLWAQYLIFITDYKYVVFASVGLLLFITVVAASIYIVRNKLKYETWYAVHLLVYLAVFGSFWHQIAVGTDITSSLIFYWYWIALYIFVFGNHLVFRFLRPIYNFYRHQFTVSKVIPENYNTTSVYITGKVLDKFRVYPGQFMILRFLSRGFWRQAHPFSLSILPAKDQLRVTIKNVGDFTSQAGKIPVGAKVIIDGPYGVFTDVFSVSKKALLIAGGIGITPVRSLMEEMLKNQKDVILLFANRTEQDIVFKEEINRLAENHQAKVVHVLSDQFDFNGEKGRLNSEKIQRLVPDLKDRDIYLCGPVPMMDNVREILKNLGIPKSAVHYEQFSLG
jgi:predicted ferric reductase